MPSYNPPIHLRRVGDEWGLCLSRLIGSFAFAWNTNDEVSALMKGQHDIERRVGAVEQTTDKNRDDISDLREKVGGKADR